MRAILDEVLTKHDKPRVFYYGTIWGCDKALLRICKDAEMAFYSSHKWGRHAFAKRLLDAGVPLHTVKDAGDWKSSRVVADNYKVLERTHIEEVIERGARAFGSPKISPTNHKDLENKGK